MFGIEDPGVWLAYLLCILSTLFCVVYGLVNWNRGDDPVYSEDRQWADAKDKEDETL